MQDSKRGFTIVELLIVIVVIGILAAIVIVAYNGIQQRARNAARISAAEQAFKLINIALTTESPSVVLGKLDSSGGWSRACIGTGYEDIDGDGKGDCAAYEGDPYVSETSAFNTLLKSSGSLPSMSGYPPTTSTDGDVVAGPYLEEGTVDGKSSFMIEYSLDGLNQDCTLRPIVKNNVTSSSINTASGSGVSECIVYVGPAE